MCGGSGHTCDCLLFAPVTQMEKAGSC
jgi:hypothetical protein